MSVVNIAEVHTEWAPAGFLTQVRSGGWIVKQCNMPMSAPLTTSVNGSQVGLSSSLRTMRDKYADVGSFANERLINFNQTAIGSSFWHPSTGLSRQDRQPLSTSVATYLLPCDAPAGWACTAVAERWASTAEPPPSQLPLVLWTRMSRLVRRPPPPSHCSHHHPLRLHVMQNFPAWPRPSCHHRPWLTPPTHTQAIVEQVQLVASMQNI